MIFLNTLTGNDMFVYKITLFPNSEILFAVSTNLGWQKGSPPIKLTSKSLPTLLNSFIKPSITSSLA